MTSILGIPFIVLGILGDGVNYLDNLAPNYTSFVCTLCGIKFGHTENGYALLTMGELWIINLFYTICFSPKIISYILCFRLFKICSFGYGCSTKSLSNICCFTCLTHPSFTSLSIRGHYVITCLLILWKTYILKRT
jgi:hypothetical protein